MGRLNRDQLNIIKDKFSVKQLWSFSKVSTYSTCSWLYKLKYIDRIRVKGDNCWTWWGTVSHDLIQGLYDGEHTYDEMIGKFEDKILEYNVMDSLKFPDESQYESYIANLRHYFQNVKQLPYNVVNEKPVLATFTGKEQYVFQGYIDSEFVDEDGNLVILDYKTSSISGFSGDKLIEKSRQLMIYAFGISLFGRQVNGKMQKFPLNKIRIRYDMMKYLNITYLQKNGKEKTTKSERRSWVAKLSVPLRKDLEEAPKQIESLEKEIAKLEKKIGMKKTTQEEAEAYAVEIEKIHEKIGFWSEHLYDILEVNEMIDRAITENTLDSLPKHVRDKYTVTDCYIDVEMTEDIINEFKLDLVKALDEITEKTAEGNPDEAFTRGHIGAADSFYCVNLCDMKNHCSFYKEYQEHNAMFIDKKKEAPSDEELLKMLGL